jgi:hypothetical protein
MKRSLLGPGLFVAGILAAGPGDARAGGFATDRSVHTNPAGGVTGKFAAGVKGPNGGMAGRTHEFATDGQENAVGGSAAAFKTSDGAQGVRAGMTTRLADGAVRRQSGGAASGANGSASSYSGFTRNADGTVNGFYLTSAQSETSAASHQGNTSDSSRGEVQHSSSCTSASDDMVTCPGQK